MIIIINSLLIWASSVQIRLKSKIKHVLIDQLKNGALNCNMFPLSDPSLCEDTEHLLYKTIAPATISHIHCSLSMGSLLWVIKVIINFCAGPNLTATLT